MWLSQAKDDKEFLELLIEVEEGILEKHLSLIINFIYLSFT